MKRDSPVRAAGQRPALPASVCINQKYLAGGEFLSDSVLVPFFLTPPGPSLPQGARGWNTHTPYADATERPYERFLFEFIWSILCRPSLILIRCKPW